MPDRRRYGFRPELEPEVTLVDPAAKPPRSRTLLIWLIVGTIAAVLGIVPAAMMGMMSVMATDSGDADAAIYVFIWTALTFPIAMVLGPVVAWIAWFFRRELLAWIFLFAPLAWTVVLVLILVFASGDMS